MFIPTLTDELVLTKILEVAILLPEFKILAVGFKACDLVQDAQVCGIVTRTEVIRDLLQELKLLFSQVRVAFELSKI